MKRYLSALETTSSCEILLPTTAEVLSRRTARSVVAALALLAAAHGAVGTLNAQEVRRFINPGVGDWDDPANWESAQLPNGTTNVVIDSAGTAQLTTANPLARWVYLGGANGQPGTLEIVSGGRLTALNILAASDTAAGTLLVRDGGTLVSGPSAIAGVPGMPAAATVDGAGSLWQGSGYFFAGGPGGGAMSIVNGGEFSLTGGLDVGVNTGANSGKLLVDGVGSKATITGLLWIGYRSGNGSLVVQNGGVVSSGGSDLAQDQTPSPPSSGSALVTGVGSQWSIAEDIRVGVVGAATLDVLDGGLVTSGRSSIGATLGSMGTVTVGGAGSEWRTAGRLLIGGNAWTGAAGGVGTLSVQPGGNVVVGDSAVLFAGSTLSLAGGALTTDKLQLQGGAFDWTSGTLHVGSASGAVVNQGGVLAPGLAAGTTSIVGGYTQQAAGALEIELGGAAAGAEFDVVSVGGNAALDGQLRLAMLNGYVPAAGTTFAVLNAASLSGEFSNAAPGQRVPTADGAASFVVDYGATSPFDPNQIVLSGFQFAADVDGNGMVDGQDLVAWQMGFGLEEAARADGDADADLDVDGADFLAWQQQLGFGEEQGGAAAIPEPSAGLLVTAGGLAIVSRCGRKRRAICSAAQQPSVRRGGLLAALALGVLSLSSSPRAQAASVFWTGQGTTPYWNNDDNWSGGILPTNDGSSDLYFGAAGGTYATVANIPGSTTYGALIGSNVAGGEIRGMTFLPAAGAYNINAVDTPEGRDGIIMRSGGIVNLSPNMQTFLTHMYHDDRFASQIDGGVGGLRFNEGFSNLGGGTSGISQLGGSGPIIFEKFSSFSHGFGVPSLVKTGSGTVTFRQGVGSDSNKLQINGGVVDIRPNPLPNGRSFLGAVYVNANSSLLLSGGALLELHYHDVGLQINSGVANISGAGTSLLAARDIVFPEPTLPLMASTVGNGGSSTLNVNAQARAVFDSLTIGASSNGQLSVQNAARVENGTAVLGKRAGVSGTAQVNGAGSSWSNTGDLLVGESGTGALEIRGGASVTNFRAHIGFQSGSIGSVLVTDPGSSWSAGGSMFIGNGGGGAIQVLNGATAATAGNAYLGVSTFSTGEATVRSAGSTWSVANTLYVGGNADGAGGPFASTLRVEDGGRVNAGSTTLYNTGVIELTNNATLSGPLVSKGGTLRTFGNIDYADNVTLDSGNLSVVNFTNGAAATFGGTFSGLGGLNKTGLGAAATLKLTGHSNYAGPTTINSGALVVDGSITSAATVNNGATLGGSGAVGPVTVMGGGILSPGGSAGMLTTGDASLQGGATYMLDLASDGGGAAGSQWDSLAVNGALDISTLNAASPLNIRLRTLGVGGQPGALEQWTPGVDHTWSNIITTTAGTIGAFDSSLFRLDATGFAGAMHGSFNVVPNGGNFDLVYDATEIPSGVLVSNLAEPLRYATPIGNNPNPVAPPEGEGQPWYWGAQKFTNDGRPHQLVSIGAKIGGGSTEPAPVVVAELRADNGGVMGDLIATLSAPDLSGDIADRELTPDAAVTLTPGADYWVLLGSQSPGDGTYFWQYANSNFAVGSGTLANYADSNDSGATWIYRSADFPYFLQVNVANVAPPVADFDGDGVVDDEDLARWQIGFGIAEGALLEEGDADVDGDVDGADFLAWQRQLGGGAASAASSAVPEPASVGIVLSGALALRFLRRVRSHSR